MSVTTRRKRKRKGATKNERARIAAERWTEWLEHNKHTFYGPADRRLQCWALRNAAGRVVELALAQSQSTLRWNRDGVPAGWSVGTICGHYYDYLRFLGLPLVEGHDPRTNAEIHARLKHWLDVTPSGER